jgi:hypothetical protein
MVLSPAGKLSFDEVLQRVECPVCLAYGEPLGAVVFNLIAATISVFE